MDDFVNPDKSGGAGSAKTGDAAVIFLKQLRKDGPWMLLAIAPEGGVIEAKTVKTPDEIRGFVAMHNGVKNLYYSLNPTRKIQHKKAAKTDIARIEFVPADLDPKHDEPPEDAKKRYLEAIAKFDKQPTAIIDSGNGLNVIFKLAKPIELPEPVIAKGRRRPNGEPQSESVVFDDATQKVIADIEGRAAQLMKDLGSAAGTQNVDRILRLPGTTNLPTKKKLCDGRVPCQAKLIKFNTTTFEPKDFPDPVDPKAERAKAKAKAQSWRSTAGKKEPSKRLIDLLLTKHKGAQVKYSVGGYEYESRSGLLYGFLRGCIQEGISEDVIFDCCIGDLYAGSAIWEHCHDQQAAGIDPYAYLERQLERTEAKLAEAIDETDLTDEQKALPVMRYGPLSQMADQAAKILIEASVPFYQRGGHLVRPIQLEAKSFFDEDTFTMQLVEVDIHYLRGTLCRHSRWVKFDKRSMKWVPAHPPVDACNLLLSSVGDWAFPVLAGVITTPTLRPDGSILKDEGYDPSTQFLLMNPPAMPEIPEKPTRADAEAALTLLKGLLVEFPFVDDLSHAVALSAQISTICRGAYPVMPMHVIDAPVAGSGKSYLLSTVAWIATGHSMPVFSAGKTAEETEKRLGAAVIQGQSLVCIDNVEGELGGDALCQLIEQPRPHIRVLGASKLVEIDARSLCIFANGNNIVSVGDIYRREIRCRLNPEVERPEKREFESNPRAMILADRGAYVAACLVIVRAYIVAGRPNKCGQLASFNDWSSTVRSALVWLGEADCIESMDTSKGDDPRTIAHQTLLREWSSEFGTGFENRVAAADVIEKCEHAMSGVGSLKYIHAELRAAVLALTPAKNRYQVDVNALGQWLKAIRDKWTAGMCFRQDKNLRGEVTWFIEVAGEGDGRPQIKRRPVKTQ